MSWTPSPLDTKGYKIAVVKFGIIQTQIRPSTAAVVSRDLLYMLETSLSHSRCKGTSKEPSQAAMSPDGTVTQTSLRCSGQTSNTLLMTTGSVDGDSTSLATRHSYQKSCNSRNLVANQKLLLLDVPIYQLRNHRQSESSNSSTTHGHVSPLQFHATSILRHSEHDTSTCQCDMPMIYGIQYL